MEQDSEDYAAIHITLEENELIEPNYYDYDANYAAIHVTEDGKQIRLDNHDHDAEVDATEAVEENKLDDHEKKKSDNIEDDIDIPFLDYTVYKRKFHMLLNDTSDSQLEQETDFIQYNQSQNITATSDFDDLKRDKLDTLRSGESLVKYYNFDTTKYNKDTEKCVAFWKTVMQQKDLQPIKCPSLKCQERKSSVSEDNDSASKSCMWYNTLVELQKRKMDEVALAASAQQCKLCDREEPYAEFKRKQGQRYSESELRDYEDITCLNYWPHKPKPKFTDASTDVQHVNSLEGIRLYMPVNIEKAIYGESENFPSTVEDEKVTDEQEIDVLTENVTDEQESNSHHTCKCKKDICRCNESNLNADELLTIYVHEDDILESQTTYSTASEMDKFESQSCTQVRSKQDDEKLKSTTKNVSSEISEGKLKTKCAICNKIHCQCKEHLDEDATRFLDHLKFQLKSIRKDKSSATEKVEEKKIPKTKQYCIICGHNDCNCKETESKPQTFFMHFGDDMEAPSLTKSENLSNHIREDISHREQSGLSKLSKLTMTPKLSPTTANLAKSRADKGQKRSKAVTNRNVIIAEPDKYGIPQVIQHAPGGRSLPKSVQNDDVLSDSSSSEFVGQSKLELDKVLEVSDKKLEVARKASQKPMLWYCSDMPPKYDGGTLSG